MSRNPNQRYVDRIDRLRDRANFLRALIARDVGKPRSREIAELSALDWAVAQLEQWFGAATGDPFHDASVERWRAKRDAKKTAVVVTETGEER